MRLFSLRLRSGRRRLLVAGVILAATSISASGQAGGAAGTSAEAGRAGAAAASGEVFVVDPSAGTGERGLLFGVNPLDGSRRVVTNFNDGARGELGLHPVAVGLDGSGTIFVLDSRLERAGCAGERFRGLLFRVDATDGSRTIASDFCDGTQGPRGRSPVDLAVDVSEILYLDCCPTGHLFAVDAGGIRTVVSTWAADDGPHGSLVLDVAVGPGGDIYVEDWRFTREGCESISTAIWRVDRTSGDRTEVTCFQDPAQGVTADAFPGDETVDGAIAIDASGAIVAIAKRDSDGHRVLLNITPRNGLRTVLHDLDDPLVCCVPVSDARDIAIDDNGNFLIVDPAGGTEHRGALIRIDRLTGVRTVVTDFGQRQKGEREDERAVHPTALAVGPTLPTQLVDLTIRDLEITQAIQNLHNDVRLVEGKTTYVRVYPSVDTADRRVGARLRGFRKGVELGPPLRPLNPAVTVRRGGAERAESKDSFNFWVPPDWRSGTVTFVAEINPEGVPETDSGNNTFQVTTTFVRASPACVLMVPVRTHGSRYTVHTPGFHNIIDRFESLWPVPDVWIYYESEDVAELEFRLLPLPHFVFGPYEMEEGWSLKPPFIPDSEKVLISLMERSVWTNDPDECEVNSLDTTHFVGMVSPDSNTGDTLGAAYYSHPVSWVHMVAGGESFSAPLGGTVMAHELSHNHGRRHVDCPVGGPDNADPDYPYGSCNIGLDKDEVDLAKYLMSHWGFDSISRVVIAPDEASDYMSDELKVWVSDYTWDATLEMVKIRDGARAESSEVAREERDGAELLVVGGALVPPLSVATIDFAYRLPPEVLGADRLEHLQSNLASPAVAIAPNVLELLDADGSVLLSQPFESGGSVHGSPAEVFLLTVPFDPDTARIRIARAGRELVVLDVSKRPPQVQIQKPSGGEAISDSLRIRWQGSDDDQDPLLYTVEYSPDLGASWQALVTRTPQTSLTVDTAGLPGSFGQALVRVIANDGVNTGSATSSPFSVQLHAPVARIDTPSDGAVFAENSQIILSGGASDAEEGALAGETLTWFVNGELLGSGDEVALDAVEPGTYVITLEATDADDNTGSARVAITVGDDMPVASPDSYSTTENTSLIVDAPGVLANDTDPEGDPLSAVLVSDVSNGLLTLDADGSFTYEPNLSFSGSDSFVYKATDGATDSNVVTVDLTVNPIELWPDLTINKVAGTPNPVHVGQRLSYAIFFANNGPGEAPGASLGDILPPGVAFVSATSTRGRCVESNGVVHCALGRLSTGKRGTVTIKVMPRQAGQIVNRAFVWSDRPDRDESNNGDDEVTAVAP